MQTTDRPRLPAPQSALHVLSTWLAWAFKNADWLTADRARAWSRILAALLFIRVAAWIILPRNGDLIAGDFVCYWAAAHFAAAGHAALAYDPALLAPLEHTQFAFMPNAGFPFLYPPSFLLLLLPLGLLPYLPALLAFLAAGFVPFFASVRQLLPQRWAVLPIVAFPGAIVTAGTGQNGFLSAACFGGYMVLLDQRPILAGACLGFLSYKPHFALCVPVALLAARRWRAVTGAAISVITLTSLSLLVFGQNAWFAFLEGLPTAGRILTHDILDPAKVQSTFGAFRIMHLPVAAGAVTQGIVSICGLAVLGAVTWRRPGGRAEGAILAAAALVCSPYLVDYDLVILGLPLAWVLAEAVRTGFRPWEKIVLLLAYVLPILSHGLGAIYHIPTAPFGLCAILAIVARRVSSDGKQASASF